MARRVTRARSILRKHWHLVQSSQQDVVTATQSVVASFLGVEGERVETILRTRGNLVVEATPDAATDSDILGLGLAVLSQNAITVGGASVPGPINDGGFDFFWYQLVCLSAGGATAVGSANILCNRIIEIDSKAMRKLGTEQGIALIAEIASGDFALVTVTASFRFLLGS